MKIIKIISILVFIFPSFLSCDENDTKVTCDDEIFISAEMYNSAPNDYLNINEVRIEDDCLFINFGSSGCSGESWELKLIDSSHILESYPPQRNIRLSLKNEEACQAYFIREVSFDISSLQIEGVDSLYLNIENFDDQILYEY